MYKKIVKSQQIMRPHPTNLLVYFGDMLLLLYYIQSTLCVYQGLELYAIRNLPYDIKNKKKKSIKTILTMNSLFNFMIVITIPLHNAIGRSNELI